MTKERHLSSNTTLMSEWAYEHNNGLDPTSISYGSNKYAWWKCSKCDHIWRAKISNRTILHRGCPCCANTVTVKGINDIATTRPELAKEWHPTKNGILTPFMVTVGSNKKVWWQCPMGHEYLASISHRGHGTNCPICNSGRQTSFAEQAVLFYIKQFFPDAIGRYKADFLKRMELDIYIPSKSAAIEYDGEAWHRKDKAIREHKKYLICKEHNIHLIRLREKTSENTLPIADYQIIRSALYEPRNLKPAIMELLYYLGINKQIDIDIARDRFEILATFHHKPKNSIASTHPHLMAEWHPSKNQNISPDMFTAGSDYKVWWRCQACENEWECSINHRTHPRMATGCPICGIEKSTQVKRKAVYQIEPTTGEIINQFISISDASRKLKINVSNISMTCTGKRPMAGGYIWRYTE
ncbi:MAG TPA: hypothetical protein IAD02_01550 [Candidatus Enterousia intestinigallinarum]|uniref:Treble clef zinc finger domain-containing protein n=1 Tax=Candidatus Enterousia intestinigallinarum TaxID=2840790 RepID=A0A9D1FFJ5_9PROT|nr:hypothetical protein [Candidatus Enterousia intestinigallinarum]